MTENKTDKTQQENTQDDMQQLYTVALELKSKLDKFSEAKPLQCDALSKSDLVKIMAIDKRIKYTKTEEKGKDEGVLLIPKDQYNYVLNQLIKNNIKMYGYMKPETEAVEQDEKIKPYLDQLVILEAKATELLNRAVVIESPYGIKGASIVDKEDLKAAQAMLSACEKLRKPFSDLKSDTGEWKNIDIKELKQKVRDIEVNLDAEIAILSTHRGYKGILEKIINFFEKLIKKEELTKYDTDSSKKMADFKNQFQDIQEPDNQNKDIDEKNKIQP